MAGNPDPDHASPPLTVAEDSITVAGGVGCSAMGRSPSELLSTLLCALGALTLRRRGAR